MSQKPFLPLRSKRTLWAAQFTLSGLALAMCVWFLTDYVKRTLFGPKDFGLYPWTYLFFHPVEANLFNYLVVCLVIGFVALVLYIIAFKRISARPNGNLEGISFALAAGSIVLSALVLAGIWLTPSLKIRVLGSLAVTCCPMLWLTPRLGTRLHPGAPLIRYGGPTLCVLLLVWASIEQLSFFRMPVYLMNEYADIYGETKVRDRYVNNRDFLETVTETDMKAVKLFFDLLPFIGYHTYPEVEEGIPFGLFRRFNLEPAHAYLISLASKATSPGSDGAEGYRELLASLQSSTYGRTIPRSRAPASPDAATLLPRVEEIDVEGLKRFYNANAYEHSHQNMGRGQINHIGHILNPLNEYELGKPLQDIYMQYGLGNTMLMKWIMDRFGGISFQNYYKTYLFYTVYFCLFLAMAFYLFKEWLYTLAAFSALPVCFFFMGYTAFIVAPGIVPSIHLLDAPAVAFFVWYLRSGRVLALGCAVAAALIAIALNSQFGLVLSASLLVTLVFFVLERKRGIERIHWAFFFIVFLGASLAAFRMVQIGQIVSVFPYFVTGLFSWPVRRSIVVLTLLYLVISYIFLLAIRKDRSELKYTYLFLFAYSQATLLYFFWSGLVNHLPPVLPFLWLQFLLMLFIVQRNLRDSRPAWSVRTYEAVAVLALLALILLVPGALHFYREKGDFLKNFIDHRTYRWPFERAAVVSTIDPGLIQESVALIQAHSTGTDRGIHMLSKYDGMLPFLANRFSAMPLFDLTGYLLSPREYELALRAIKERRPAYLFVDTNIRSPGDAWGLINARDKGYTMERASRLSRYDLLRKLFEQVAPDYEKIVEGRLISVYRRIPGR